MNPYIIPRGLPSLDRTQDWYTACYQKCQAATQLLWHNVQPYHKGRGLDPSSSEGDQFQQYYMVYDPNTDPRLVHIYYMSYVHGGYAGKVLRCNQADYRYYILWVEEDRSRVSCLDYVRYHGRYRHRQCDSWWVDMSTEHAYTVPPTLGRETLHQKLGLPDHWHLDMAGLSIREEGRPLTARYMGWYDYIVASDWRDKRTILIDMKQYTDNSWQPAQLYTREQEAATSRLRLIEQELVARTWHPKRFLDWCIPACEKEDLVEE